MKSQLWTQQLKAVSLTAGALSSFNIKRRRFNIELLLKLGVKNGFQNQKGHGNFAINVKSNGNFYTVDEQCQFQTQFYIFYR